MTYHYDALRTGWNQSETTLTPANVQSAAFGRLLTVTLGNEQVDAQPLVVSAAAFASAGLSAIYPNDVAYVATSLDNVYMIDSKTGATLRQISLGTAVSTNNLPGMCGHSFNTVGINSTPVIDFDTGALYVISYTWENSAPVYRIHELSLGDLHEIVPSLVIAASHTLPDGVTIVNFNPVSERQRPALLLTNGHIFAAFGSFCDLDADTSRGWVLAWKTGSLTPQPNSLLLDQQTSADPSGIAYTDYYLSGVWMSGYGVAADAVGSIYFVTGNSNGNHSANLPESAVKVSVGSPSTLDFFTPFNFLNLDLTDSDFGSGGLMVVPDQASGAHFAVAAGKVGLMYLMNRDHMGGFTPHGPDVPPSVQIGGCWCGPSYFVGSDGAGRIVSSGGSNVETWLLPATSTGVLTYEATAPAVPKSGDPGFMNSVSSNGTKAGTQIIWTLSRNSAFSVYLGAFAATATTGQMQQLGSFLAGSWAGAQGNANLMPVVANGKVYVASYGQLEIFGLSN